MGLPYGRPEVMGTFTARCLLAVAAAVAMQFHVAPAVSAALRVPEKVFDLVVTPAFDGRIDARTFVSAAGMDARTHVEGKLSTEVLI